MRSKVQVKTYKGSQQGAMEAFQNDSARMAEQGYFPTAQSWAAGSYGCGSFLIALLLCFVFFIGILVFIYMIIVKPDGTLTVTYELRIAEKSQPQALDSSETKVCPKCAETVKLAATVCRFCGHEFK